MAKLTKREYNKSKTALQQQLQEVENKLSIIDNWSNTSKFYTNYSWKTATEQQKKTLDIIGEYWNGLHDKKDNIENDLHNLEIEYSKRNWSYSDYMFNELVMNNVD